MSPRWLDIFNSFNQKPSKNNNNSPIPYRTGCSSAYQQRRTDNAKNSPLYRLPTELHLEVMSYLGPTDLYILRQTSAVFLMAFAHHMFLGFHRPISGANRQHPSDRLLFWGAPTLPNRAYWAIHLQHQNSENIFRPIIEFNRHQLSVEGAMEVVKLMKRDFLCQSCLAAIPAAAPWQHSADHLCRREELFCVACGVKHSMTFFSETQLGRDRPVCIGWEGRMKVCPHRQISLRDTFNALEGKRAVPLPCPECEVEFQADQGEKCPALFVSRVTAESDPNLFLKWTMQVCQLAEGQVVTKDLMRQGLESLEARFGNRFLCHHMTFRDPKLMIPFEWERCVCFRDSMSENQECYRHKYNKDDNSDCCACNARSRPDAVGSFMVLKKSRRGTSFLHKIYCNHCSSEYLWAVQANSIIISRLHFCKKIFPKEIRSNTKEVRLNPEGIHEWIYRLDPGTFYGNVYHRQYMGCVDQSCWNSQHRGVGWRSLGRRRH